MRGGDVQGIHRTEARPCGFVAGVLEDQTYIVQHRGSLEVLQVETIFLLPMVEESLGANFMLEKGTAQEDPVRVFQDLKRRVPFANEAPVGGDQNAGVQEGSSAVAKHRQPFRRDRTSWRTSRRLRSLAPDATFSSANLRSMRPMSETSFLGPAPFFLAARFAVDLGMVLL